MNVSLYSIITGQFVCLFRKRPTGIGELVIVCATNLSVIFSNMSSPGGKVFLELLRPRLNPRNINGGPAMPFQLEVINI